MEKVSNHHLTAERRPTVTEVALCAWVGQAYPGEQLVYYTGFLALDTGPDSTTLTPAAKRQLRAVADRAFQLFEQGLVHLVQRREGPGDYVYIVVARTRPKPPATAGRLKAVLQQAGLSEPATVLRRSA